MWEAGWDSESRGHSHLTPLFLVQYLCAQLAQLAPSAGLLPLPSQRRNLQSSAKVRNRSQSGTCSLNHFGQCFILYVGLLIRLFLRRHLVLQARAVTGGGTAVPCAAGVMELCIPDKCPQSVLRKKRLLLTHAQG